MKALILNSGVGSRMGGMTAKQPKCMTEISSRETILSRQLQQLVDIGIKDVVITTGAFADVLVKYAQGLALPFIMISLQKQITYIRFIKLENYYKIRIFC